MFDNATTGRIVRVYKDQGERRLADEMASCMVRSLPAAWRFDAIAYVPATLSAYRYRGFDHARLLAERLAGLMELYGRASDAAGMSPSQPPLIDAFARPQSRDQRKLSRIERLRNVAGRFSADPRICADKRILVVDDVSTTGSTLLDAADALRTAGASCVYCMTFARV